MELPTRLDYPIIAIGDLHGRRGWLEKLLFRLRRHPVWPAASIVFLGDLVDRGDDVRGTIDVVLELLAEKPGSTCVMGNHDFAVNRSLGLQDALSELWRTKYATNYDHGATFHGYLGRTPKSKTGPTWSDELAALAEAMPATHRNLLADLPWVAEAEGHVFVHNGLSPKLDEPAAVQLELLRLQRWHGYVTPRMGTDTHLFYNTEYPVWLGADKSLSANPLAVPGRVIVSGHVKVTRPDATATRIRIDTTGGERPPLTACILTGPASAPEFIFSE